MHGPSRICTHASSILIGTSAAVLVGGKSKGCDEKGVGVGVGVGVGGGVAVGVGVTVGVGVGLGVGVGVGAATVTVPLIIAPWTLQ